MLEIIKEIPGPHFLFIYAVISVLTVLIAKKYAENDHTKNLEIPEPTKVSPVEIAILHKGIKGAVFISLFNLWRKKKIEVLDTGNNLMLKKISTDCSDLNKLETGFLKNIQTQKLYKHFLTTKSLITIKKILSPNIENLERLNLLANDSVKRKYWQATFFSIALLLIIGGTKLTLGISNNKPVSFLFMMMIIVVVSIVFYLKPHKVNCTNLGKRFLETATTRFEWLIKNESNTTLENNDVLYGIALFGISAFALTSIGPLMENPRRLETYTDSNYGSGCGGAGCSGGGCSGGGCGGCGGCGGD